MTEGEFNPDEDGMDDYIDDLDDLIRYLEKEAMRLKECVNNAADQWEFGHAKAFARAYGTVLRRLETLKHLKSPGTTNENIALEGKLPWRKRSRPILICLRRSCIWKKS